VILKEVVPAGTLFGEIEFKVGAFDCATNAAVTNRAKHVSIAMKRLPVIISQPKYRIIHTARQSALLA
jgi:hypothetical protein